MACLNNGALVSILKRSQYALTAAISLSFRYITCLWRRASAAFCFLRYSGSIDTVADFLFLATSNSLKISDKFPPNIGIFIKNPVHPHRLSQDHRQHLPSLSQAEAVSSYSEEPQSLSTCWRPQQYFVRVRGSFCHMHRIVQGLH